MFPATHIYRHFFLCMILVLSQVHGYSIVFIHIGPRLPGYIYDALRQARLFNEQCSIYLLANQAALQNFNLKNSTPVQIITLETMEKSDVHKEFCKNSSLDHKWGDGFWFYASERFLYLDDFMQQYELRDVFHIENDTMLYVDLAQLEPIFKKCYSGIAAVFDNDRRCIPCFVYIAHKEVMHKLAAYFSRWADQNKNDMEILALFKQQYPQDIDNLPIIMPTYSDYHVLKSLCGHVPENPADYVKNFESFNAIFDAAALGQYLAGFINESCIFNPSHFRFKWQQDELGRKIPYACFGDKKYRINNLHVHSKNLKRFASKR